MTDVSLEYVPSAAGVSVRPIAGLPPRMSILPALTKWAFGLAPPSSSGQLVTVHEPLVVRGHRGPGGRALSNEIFATRLLVNGDARSPMYPVAEASDSALPDASPRENMGSASPPRS